MGSPTGPGVAGVGLGVASGLIAGGGEVAAQIAASRSASGQALKKYRKAAATQLASSRGKLGFSPEQMGQAFQQFTRAQQAARKGSDTQRGAGFSGQDLRAQYEKARAEGQSTGDFMSQMVAQSTAQAKARLEALERIAKEGVEAAKEKWRAPTQAAVAGLTGGVTAAGKAQGAIEAEVAGG